MITSKKNNKIFFPKNKINNNNQNKDFKNNNQNKNFKTQKHNNLSQETPQA